jgi:hypothetical protein
MGSFARGLSRLKGLTRDVKIFNNLTDIKASLKTDLQFHKSKSVADEIARPLSDVFSGIIDDIRITDEHGIDFTGPTKQLDLDKFINDVRRGDMTSFSSFYETKNGVKLDNNVVSNISNYMKETFPDFKLNEYFKNVDELKFGKLNHKALWETKPYELDSLKQMYSTDPKFKKLIDNLNEYAEKTTGKLRKKITLKGVFYTFLIGGGAFLILQELSHVAKTAAGCYRIYKDTDGKLTSCKISQCSCKFPQIGRHKACTQVPKNVNELTCVDWPNKDDVGNENTGKNCRSCDPNAPKDSKQYLDPSNFVDSKDVYQCREPPSIGEIITDVIHDLPGKVIDTVTDTVNIVLEIVKYGAIFIAGAGIFAICSKVYTTLIAKQQLSVENNDTYTNNEDVHSVYSTASYPSHYIDSRQYKTVSQPFT